MSITRTNRDGRHGGLEAAAYAAYYGIEDVPRRISGAGFTPAPEGCKGPGPCGCRPFCSYRVGSNLCCTARRMGEACDC